MNFLAFLELMRSSYCQADQLNIQVPHKRHKTFVKFVLVIAMTFLLLIGFTPLTIYLLKESPDQVHPIFVAYSCVCWFTVHFIRIFFVTQFFLACCCLKTRFKLLNDKLLKLKQQKSFTAIDWRFGQLFNSLCDLVDMSNGSFTIPFIIILPNILTKSIFAAYAIASQFHLSSSDSLVTLIMCGFFLLNYSLILILLSWIGSDLEKTAGETGKIITQMMSEGFVHQHQKTDFMFLQSQVRSRNVNVQNFLFSINWRIAMSVSWIDLNEFVILKHSFVQMISTFVTYLIIICQLK
jgi:hypothetical protein